MKAKIKKENTVIYPQLSFDVAGILFQTHKDLGRFRNEKQYCDCIEKLLKKHNIAHEREKIIPQSFVGEQKGRNKVDFIIDDKIILEVKAKRFVTKEDYYQTKRYLVSFNKKLAILVNMRAYSVTPKRILNSEITTGIDSEKRFSQNSRSISNHSHSSVRKICFVITSFIHYARSLLILDELRKNDGVDLHIVLGGTAVLPKYSSKYAQLKTLLEKDGFGNISEVHFNLEGDTPTSKAKTIGMGIMEFASFFDKITPYLVVLRGDRFEVLAAAVAASNMNLPIAHIEGGDTTGTLDESIRHSITKLAHIHFPTNKPAEERIKRMGERKEFIFNFGSPEVEVVRKLAIGEDSGVDFEKTGSGSSFDYDQDFLMVMYHPVSTEIEEAAQRTRILLEAVHELGLSALWHWPNFDAGAEEISHEIRIFKDEVSGHKIRFTRFLPPKTFLSLLNKTKCLVGNSSAGVKECSYLGVPAVNIGTRQNNRLRADNIIDVEEDKESIKNAIKKQIEIGRYEPSDLYCADNTSKNIADTLSDVGLYIQKEFED